MKSRARREKYFKTGRQGIRSAKPGATPQQPSGLTATCQGAWPSGNLPAERGWPIRTARAPRGVSFSARAEGRVLLTPAWTRDPTAGLAILRMCNCWGAGGPVEHGISGKDVNGAERAGKHMQGGGAEDRRIEIS